MQDLYSYLYRYNRQAGAMDNKELTSSGDLGFGALLRSFRLRAGLTQGVLAERAGISVEAVGALERGSHRAPYLSTLGLLADALELSPGDRDSLEAAAGRGRARTRTREPDPPRLLPAPATSFIGRENELDDLMRLLRRSRIVTIVGFGGIGKTRVAIEVAKRIHLDTRIDVRFVDLSAPETGSVISKIGAALNLSDFRDTPEGLAAVVAARSFLLVLDNCEGDLDAVATAAAAIVKAAPGFQLLATSREPLNVSGEVLYRLKPLALPPEGVFSDEQVSASPSVRLFRERAGAHMGEASEASLSPRHLSQLCHLLEGIPLAIELAAARVSTFGADELLKRLDDEFVATSIARDVPQRQRTMATTMEWSHGLLTEDERTLFRRLAIFHSGFMLEAAEFVCSDSELPASEVPRHIAALVDKSLLQVSHEPPATRYRMLDLVHRYAHKALTASGECEHLAHALAAWYSARAEDFGLTEFRMPAYTLVARYHAEIPTIQSSLEWVYSAGGADSALTGARIISGLRSLWIASGQYLDLRKWLDVARSRIDEQQAPFLASRLLWASYWSLTGVRRIPTARRVIELLGILGERQNSAIVMMHLAYSLYRSGDIAAAQACAQDGYAIIADLNWHRSSAHAFYLTVRALLETHQGRFDRARADLDMADQLARAESDDYIYMMWSPPIRVEIEFIAGNVDGAMALLDKTLERQLGRATEAIVSDALHARAAISLLRGDIPAGIRDARQLLERTLGYDRERLIGAIALLASGLAQSGQTDRAARLMGFVDNVYRDQEYFRNAFDLRIAQQVHDVIRADAGEARVRDLLHEGSQMGLDATLSFVQDDAVRSLGS